MPDIRSGVSVSPDAFGAGVGAAIANVGGAVADVEYRRRQKAEQEAEKAKRLAEEEKRKADQVATLDAGNNTGAFMNQLLFDPKSGAMLTRGRDAFGVTDQAMTAYQKHVDETMGKLANDEQKAAYKRYADNNGLQLQETLMRHAAQEGTRYDAQTTESALDLAKNDAVSNFADPRRVAVSLEKQRAILRDHARRNGVDPDGPIIQSRVAALAAETHVGVIDRMLSADRDADAEAYFKAHREEIAAGGQDAGRIQDHLAQVGFTGEAQRRSDALYGERLEEGKALEKARDAISDPKLKDAVIQRLKARYEEDRALKERQQAEVFEKFDNDIVSGRATIDDIRKGLGWSVLRGDMKAALESRYERRTKGVEPTNDDTLWVKFIDKPTAELAKLTQADMLLMRSKLDDQHFERALGMWQQAKELAGRPAAIKSPELSSTLTFHDRVDNTIKLALPALAAKSRSGWNADDARTYANFEQAAAREVENFELTELNGNRKATGEEVQKILDKLIIRKVFVEEWGRDPEKSIFAVKPDEYGAAYVPYGNVPEGVRTEIENYIKSEGNIPTADRVEKAYAAYLLGDRELLNRAVKE